MFLSEDRSNGQLTGLGKVVLVNASETVMLRDSDDCAWKAFSKSGGFQFSAFNKM